MEITKYETLKNFALLAYVPCSVFGQYELAAWKVILMNKRETSAEVTILIVFDLF